MPINVWSAGQDALLDTIARRDAERRLEEDRARRDRIDQEALADRDRQRGIQEGQLRSIDEDRDERRRMAGEAAAEKKAAGQAAALNAEQIGELLDAYDAAQSPEEKHSIGLKILNAGGKYQAPPRPVTAPRDPIADHLAKKKIDQQFKEPSAAKGPKDNPSLPNGAKVWIESIAQRGIPLEQARNELSRGWGQQRQAHPGAELAAAADYLTKLYPTAPDPMAAAPRAPLGAPPAEETAAAAVAPPAAQPPAQDAQVQGLLKNAGPGRYTLSNGEVCLKLPDGTIQKGS